MLQVAIALATDPTTCYINIYCDLTNKTIALNINNNIITISDATHLATLINYFNKQTNASIS